MYTHEYTTYEYTVNVSRDRADADYPAALNLSSREEWTIITAAWQPSHRAVGNPPISSAALFAQHARTRRRSKARRRSSARARQPGRDALEHSIQKAHRCRPAEGSAEKALSKEATTVRKCHDGASLQRNRSELSENAARGPLFRLPTTSNPALRPQNRRSQMSPTPNFPFRPSNMPAMRPPCGVF